MVYAVLLSGGIGNRIGADIPKQFIEINNKPLLAYCIEKFTPIKEFKRIIISSPIKYIDKTNKLVEKFFPNESRIDVIVGGETRQNTLMNSLHHINNIKSNNKAIVINHDAARIFVSTSIIKECIEYTKKYGASSPVIASTDVIVKTKNNKVTEMPNRYDLVHVQTPQGFEINEYLDLFNDLTEEEIESVHEIIRIYYLRNKYIYLFNGEKSNFKITNPIDIEIAKSILR